MLSLIILIFIVIQVSDLQADSGPIVNTSNGKVMGAVVNNGNSGPYYAFRSIPYAEPPIGDLRFEPPVALKNKYLNTLDATKEPPMCMQLFMQDNKTSVLGIEDCLYLNIYTPKIGLGKKNYLPVMVFLHGGGLMYGDPNFYGEQHIMSSGKILLVTVAYRLNAFGFLSTEDNEILGNMGFKDQTMALRWINKNIVNFGGNKNQVILSGWSAGAASVHYHMVSAFTPSKLFKCAVSFSGVALSPFYAIYTGEALKKTRKLAELLHCPSNELASSKGIKHCLKRREASDIILQTPHFFHFAQNPFNIFGAVIENSKSRDKFLTQQVSYLMRRDYVKRKPWLITRTNDDGAIGAAQFLKKDENGVEEIYKLNDNWAQWAPTLLFVNPMFKEEERIRIVMKYRTEYFGTQNITMENYQHLERLLNDVLSTEHIKKTSSLFVEKTRRAQAYGYIYDNPPPFGLGQLNSRREDIKFGTIHGDDMFLIFNTTVRQNHPYRIDEKSIMSDMIDMLVTFGRTGVPAYAGKNLTKLTSEYHTFDKITKAGLLKE